MATGGSSSNYAGFFVQDSLAVLWNSSTTAAEGTFFAQQHGIVDRLIGWSNSSPRKLATT